jgi:putative peptidoglycan lipid II flippase
MNGAVIIAISVLLSRVLGIAREILLAHIAGIDQHKNALDLAFLVPDLLNHIISTGFLSITFIPMFTGYLVANKQTEAWHFFSRILTTLGLLLLVLIVPAWVFIEPILLFITAESPSPEVLSLAVEYGRIILPAQIFFFAGTFLVAVQHIQRQFFIPAFTGLIYNVSIIAGGWLGKDYGLIGFAWGVPVGAFIGFFALQLYGASRSGIYFKPRFSVTNPAFLKFVSLTIPLVLGVGAMFGLEFITRAYGGSFGDSGISALNYAYRMMYTLVAVFGFSVGVAGYPGLAKLAQQGNIEQLNQTVYTTINRMILVLVPVVTASWMASDAIIRLLFERGAFTSEATTMVAGLFRWYLPASVALCAQVILVRSFYAKQQMWLPTIINTGIFAASLPVYGLLQHPLGIHSVPLIGCVVAYLQVACLVLVWQLQNKGQRANNTAFVQFVKNTSKAILVLTVGVLVGQNIPVILQGMEQSLYKDLVMVLLLAPVVLLVQFMVFYFSKHNEMDFIFKKLKLVK